VTAAWDFGSVMTELAVELTDLARRAGANEADLTILAEGNAAACDEGADRFLVKASGVLMGNANNDDWVWLRLSACIEILEEARIHGRTPQIDQALDHILQSATTPDGKVKKASIETLVHVVAFHLFGATWSLHTHPTPVVALASSVNAAAHYSGSIFPDESVMCGPIPLYLPYDEPGLALGLGLYLGALKYQQEHGVNPRQIILGNHGLCTYGTGRDEALATTEMAVKAARVRIGALSAGGINFIPAAQAQVISQRPDEIQRRKIISDEIKK
jgi:rhamnose utilization protein RhaD (predicted bifunctional aldolase and dehydrogenase)